MRDRHFGGFVVFMDLIDKNTEQCWPYHYLLGRMSQLSCLWSLSSIFRNKESWGGIKKSNLYRAFMFNHNLKETYYAFPLACYIGSGAYKKILKAKKVKKYQQKLLSRHEKYCSWNTSSVVPPLILWLRDITLCLIYAQQLVLQMRIALAQLLCCCWCCWLRRVWAG